MEIGNTSLISKSFMEGKISLRYDKESAVLIKKCFGDISVNELIDSWVAIIRDFSVADDMRGIVIDFSEAYFDFPASDHEYLVNFFTDHLVFFEKYRIGIVANSPHNIVVAMLVARADSRYCLRPFTTLRAAFLWVQNFS